MAKAKSAEVVASVQEAIASETPDGASALISALTKALTEAIQSTKPVEKKNAFTRKANTPWTPKDGSPKLKLKRKTYQHSLPLDEDFLTNEEITLLNKLRPGVYLSGKLAVTRRKDKGINFTYPVRTASQRMEIANIVGRNGLVPLLERIIEEADNPVKYAIKDDE